MLIRKGECKQCGACCRNWKWHNLLADEGVIEWMKAWEPGITIMGPYETEIEGATVTAYSMSIPHPCHQFDGKGCRLHGTDKKPEICRAWPTEEFANDLPPTCGFWFEETPDAADE